MKRALRLWVGVLVSLALVGFAIAVLVYQVWFGLHATSTTATVENYSTRSAIIGRGKADVVHDVNGEPIKATLRTWYVYYHPSKGERLAVLFVPDEPGRVESDSFMQRYAPLALPLGLAVAVANWAGIFRLRRGTQGDSNQSGA
jgi:hypothetical protein